MIIPIVNAVMVGAWVIRLPRQDLADHQFRAVPGVAHRLQGQERASLYIIWVTHAKRFQDFLSPRSALLVCVALLVFVVDGIGQNFSREGVDIKLFALAG